MGDIEVDWEVKGLISAPESVSGMLKVIAEKGKNDTGTFWCWDGRVSSMIYLELLPRLMIHKRTILGEKENSLIDAFQNKFILQWQIVILGLFPLRNPL